MSAAALGQPGSEWKQPSIKVSTVKFGGLKASKGLGTKSDLLWGAWFSCDEQKDCQECLFFRLIVLD